MAPPKKVITSQAQSKIYQVINDGILGASQPSEGEAAPHQWQVLKGQVTGADLVAAGVDIAWQISIGNLQELGYVPT
jgi:hypothetical protein